MGEVGTATSTAGAPPKVHLKYVEGMRATAALIVFVNHAYAQSWNPLRQMAPTGLLSSLSYSLIAGHLSVTIFIAISGFCLTVPVVTAGDRLRDGAVAFFKRRARRILPPYYAALALCLLLIGTILGQPTGSFWDVPILVTRNAIVSHVLLLQDLFGTGSINYVFWSIAVEWQIYFFFPLLVWMWRRYGPWIALSTTLVVGYLVRILVGTPRIERAHPHYLGIFALGMLAAYVAQSGREPYVSVRQKAPWGWLCAAGFVVTVGLTWAWGLDLAMARFYVLDLPVGVMAASALVVASRSPRGALARFFSWKPLVLIGTFSYSLYLVHAPLLQMLWLYILTPAGIAPVAMFVFFITIGLAIILVASYGFFLVAEAPFLRKTPARVAPALRAA